MEAFKADIESSALFTSTPNKNGVESLTEQYNAVLRGILDSHVPLKKTSVTTRAKLPCHTDDLQLLKSAKISAETKFRKARSTFGRNYPITLSFRL